VATLPPDSGEEESRTQAALHDDGYVEDEFRA